MTKEMRQQVKKLYATASTGDVLAVNAFTAFMAQCRKRLFVRPCADCGQPTTGTRCRVHWLRHRYYSRSIAAGLAMAALMTTCLGQYLLVWEPGEFAYSYEVFQRSGTNWTLIGQTSTNNFPITNRFTAYGVIAVADATNRSAMAIVPGTPSGLRVITNTLQSASTPTGPWTNVASFVFETDTGQQQFYRGKLDIR